MRAATGPIAALLSMGVLLGVLLPGEAQGAGTFRARHAARLRAHGAGGLRALDGEAPADPAEVSVGERLFLETRFAQFFAARAVDVNRPLASGDPVVDITHTTTAPLPGAFAGKSMNCRSCHFVDDVAAFPNGRVNTYGDFSRRSFIPLRDDGRTMTPRNSPPLVNAFLPRGSGLLLHFDGEFASTADLVKGTLAGRNFGWLPTEGDAAVRHIARVVREDDGSDDIGQQFAGIPYRMLLLGTDRAIPAELVLPPAFRLDVSAATDARVFDAVAELVAAYSESLVFTQDDDGLFAGSPYDAFLAKNDLPRGPDDGESDADYSRRLQAALDELSQPLYVQGSEGAFTLHDQPWQFGRKELEGLRLFLTRGESGTRPAPNCVACHPAPRFTDFKFHNTGITQEEYDSLHGSGAFAALPIPSLSERLLNPEAYLPASLAHPRGTGGFQAAASRERPGETDLGLWNTYANPDRPRPQAAIARTLGRSGQSPEQVLPLTIALFKTPGLRDLGQSAPYFHTGGKDSLEDAVRFYIAFSEKARLGRVRNADPDIQRVFLSEGQVASLVAFLRSLNEDYQ